LQFAATTCYLRLHIEKEEAMREGLYNERVDVSRPAPPPAGLTDRLGADLPRSRAGRRWPAFILLVVTYFITIVDFTIVNVALPTIGRELRFAESDLQWLVTAYGLTFAGFLLLGGRAADLIGRRRVLMAGLAVFTASSLAGGLAWSDTFLIVMRGIQGLGAALVLPAALSIVTNMFAEGPERNKALGIWGGVGALGGTVGLLAGGLLVTYAGWRYIFFFNVPIGVAALVLTPRLVPSSRGSSGPRSYDTFGAVSVTSALLVLVYAVSQAPLAGWTSPRTVAMLAAGLALFVLFLVVEARTAAPLLPLRLFRLGSVAGSNAVGFLLGTSFLTFVFVGTLYMQQVLGFSALATGAAWMTASVTSLACAGLSQRLVTRTSPRLVMVFGMALIGAGMLWAAQAPADGSFWRDLAGPFFVAGLGTAFTFIPTSIGALAGVAERDAGVASGLLNTAQNFGGAIGVAVASSIAASYSRTLAHHGDATAAALTGGFQRALVVCGLSGLAAIPVAFALTSRPGSSG
jgi:EmrB/QacA subfamily drug resistance transporter